MRASRVIVLGLATSLVALGVTSAPGRTAPQAAVAPACFGGPPIGAACGTLTEASCTASSPI